MNVHACLLVEGNYPPAVSSLSWLITKSTCWIYLTVAQGISKLNSSSLWTRISEGDSIGSTSSWLQEAWDAIPLAKVCIMVKPVKLGVLGLSSLFGWDPSVICRLVAHSLVQVRGCRYHTNVYLSLIWNPLAEKEHVFCLRAYMTLLGTTLLRKATEEPSNFSGTIQGTPGFGKKNSRTWGGFWM